MSRVHPFFEVVESKFLDEFAPGRLDYCAELTRIIKILYGTITHYLKFDTRLHIFLPQLPPHDIICSAHYTQKIGKQHAYWSGLQYIRSIFHNWRRYFVEIQASSAITKLLSHFIQFITAIMRAMGNLFLQTSGNLQTACMVCIAHPVNGNLGSILRLVLANQESSNLDLKKFALTVSQVPFEMEIFEPSA
jgi:hypothetical protein